MSKTRILIAIFCIFQIDIQSAKASSNDNCGSGKCWQSLDPNLQSLLAPQVESCRQNLKSKQCDRIPDTDEKKRCHPSQFCASAFDDALETLKGCGMGLIDPTILNLKSMAELPIKVLGSIAKSILLCSTEKNCGIPQLSPERDSELAQNMKTYYQSISEKEKYEEAALCEANHRGYGCPLPNLSCREWDELLVTSRIPKSISDKDGYNKGLFCRDVLTKVGKQRAEAIDSDAKKAAEAVRLWLISYEQRFPCYQPKYVLVEACKALGQAGSFVTIPFLISKAATLISKGYSALEASKILSEITDSPQASPALIESGLSSAERKFRTLAANDSKLAKKMAKAGESLKEILKLDEARAKKVLNVVDKMSSEELKVFNEETTRPGWQWCE